MVNYIESLVKGVQPWRGIDNMLVSACIQHIQKDIHMGRPEALEVIDMLGDTREEQAEQFSAWRVHLIDRMMAEYDHMDFERQTRTIAYEIDEDVEYYRALMHKDKTEKEARK